LLNLLVVMLVFRGGMRGLSGLSLHRLSRRSRGGRTLRLRGWRILSRCRSRRLILGGCRHRKRERQGRSENNCKRLLVCHLFSLVVNHSS
jgi:hypothetical protein